MKPETKIILVTPSQAQKWLKLNTNNRPLKDDKVKQFSEQMKKGLWLVTNDDICFSTEGVLLNGQHRLNAVIRSGCSILMGVKTNCDPESFKVIDSDISVRTAGDGLSIAGILHGKAKAAIAKSYMMHRKGIFYENGGLARCGLSVQEIINFSQKNISRLEVVAEVAKKIIKKSKYKCLSSQHIGALYWTFSDINQQAADTFFNLYATGLYPAGNGLEESSPIYQLRNKFVMDMQSVKKYTTTDKVACMVLAWNGFRVKKKMKRILWNPAKMDFPKPI